MILLKCIGWIFLGAAVGLAFFYSFKDLSVSMIDRFKFLQGIFGISQYEEGMAFGRVVSAILVGNLISTVSYFILGYLRLLLPVSIITGFFVVVLIMTGTIRHAQAVPFEVILLMAGETFYRAIAITTGEHLGKNKLKKRWVFISSVILVFVFLFSLAVYEIYQIFGYVIP